MMNAPVVVIRHVNKEAIKACHAGERFSKKFIGKYFPFSSYGASFAKISFSIPPYRNRFSYRRSVAYKQYMKLVTFLFSFPVPPCFKPLFPSPSFQSFPTSLKYVHKIKKWQFTADFPRCFVAFRLPYFSVRLRESALFYEKSSPEYAYSPFCEHTLMYLLPNSEVFAASLPSLLSPPFPFSSTIAAFLQKRQNPFSFASAIFCRVSSSLSSLFSATRKKRILRNLPKNALVKALPLPFNRTRDFYFFSLSEK